MGPLLPLLLVEVTAGPRNCRSERSEVLCRIERVLLDESLFALFSCIDFRCSPALTFPQREGRIQSAERAVPTLHKPTKVTILLSA